MSLSSIQENQKTLLQVSNQGTQVNNPERPRDTRVAHVAFQSLKEYQQVLIEAVQREDIEHVQFLLKCRPLGLSRPYRFKIFHEAEKTRNPKVQELMLEMIQSPAELEMLELSSVYQENYWENLFEIAMRARDLQWLEMIIPHLDLDATKRAFIEAVSDLSILELIIPHLRRNLEKNKINDYDHESTKKLFETAILKAASSLSLLELDCLLDNFNPTPELGRKILDEIQLAGSIRGDLERALEFTRGIFYRHGLENLIVGFQNYF